MPEPLKPALRRRLWRDLARPQQLPPEGGWSVWWVRGGRGSGKTRTGAETLADWISSHPPGDWAVVAPTFQDARRKCLEGPAGLLRPLAGQIDHYNRSEGIIYLKSGSTVFSDGADDGALRIQGENLRGAWLDEIGLWRNWQRSWEESIRFAVRLPPALAVATATPKRAHGLVRLFWEALQAGEPWITETHMTTQDNLVNLAADAVRELEDRYGGTMLGRQELGGEVVTEVEGALWTPDMIDSNRVDDIGYTDRVVVGVDPPGGATEAGIVTAAAARRPCICGERSQRHFYVLADDSLQAPPEAWGRTVGVAYDRHQADRVIGEVNFGGDMVAAVLRSVRPDLAYKPVRASRGKTRRAEPVAALYGSFPSGDGGRVHHVGVFPELEEEMTSYVEGEAGWSPNRLDAMVWAVSELAGERQVSRDVGEALARANVELSRASPWQP